MVPGALLLHARRPPKAVRQTSMRAPRVSRSLGAVQACSPQIVWHRTAVRRCTPGADLLKSMGCTRDGRYCCSHKYLQHPATPSANSKPANICYGRNHIRQNLCTAGVHAAHLARLHVHACARPLPHRPGPRTSRGSKAPLALFGDSICCLNPSGRIPMARGCHSCD